VARAARTCSGMPRCYLNGRDVNFSRCIRDNRTSAHKHARARPARAGGRAGRGGGGGAAAAREGKRGRGRKKKGKRKTAKVWHGFSAPAPAPNRERVAPIPSYAHVRSYTVQLPLKFDERVRCMRAANKLSPLWQQSFRERSRSFHVGRNIFINTSLRQRPRAPARS